MQGQDGQLSLEKPEAGSRGVTPLSAGEQQEADVTPVCLYNSDNLKDLIVNEVTKKANQNSEIAGRKPL